MNIKDLEFWIIKSMKEANNSLKNGEVPVGCLFIINKELLDNLLKGYERKETVDSESVFAGNNVNKNFEMEIENAGTSLNLDKGNKNRSKFIHEINVEDNQTEYILISKGMNEVNTTKNATRHAEMVCIDDVINKFKNYIKIESDSNKNTERNQPKECSQEIEMLKYEGMFKNVSTENEFKTDKNCTEEHNEMMEKLKPENSKMKNYERIYVDNIKAGDIKNIGSLKGNLNIKNNVQEDEETFSKNTRVKEGFENKDGINKDIKIKNMCNANKRTNQLYEKILSNILVIVNVEPCIMCMAALLDLNIKTIIFSCLNDRFGYNILNHDKYSNYIRIIEQGTVGEFGIGDKKVKENNEKNIGSNEMKIKIDEKTLELEDESPLEIRNTNMNLKSREKVDKEDTKNAVGFVDEKDHEIIDEQIKGDEKYKEILSKQLKIYKIEFESKTIMLSDSGDLFTACTSLVGLDRINLCNVYYYKKYENETMNILKLFYKGVNPNAPKDKVKTRK